MSCTQCGFAEMQGEPGVGIKGEKGDSGPPGSRVSDNGLYYYSNVLVMAQELDMMQ